MNTQYTQCFHCHGWLRLDQGHFTANVDNKPVHFHDEACLRYAKVCHHPTDIKRVPATVYQD